MLIDLFALLALHRLPEMFSNRNLYEIFLFVGNDQDRARGYADVRLQSRDESNHQVGRNIQLQCAVQGNIERPYEYTYTKDGRPLETSKYARNDFRFEKQFRCVS